MKKIILIVACLGLIATSAFCQNATGSHTTTGTKSTKATALKAKPKEKPKPPVPPPTQYFCPKCHEAHPTADICPHCGLHYIKEGTYYCKTCYATGAGPGKCVKDDKEMVPIDGRP